LTANLRRPAIPGGMPEGAPVSRLRISSASGVTRCSDRSGKKVEAL
jgi:hypothetical protein